VDLHLGNLTEIANTVLNADTKEDTEEGEYEWNPVADSWNAVRELITSLALKTVLQAKEVRKHGLKSYFKAFSIVESISKVAVTSQNTTVEVIFNNFNIVSILPTKTSLGFDPVNDTEQVVDDLKLLAFKIKKDANASESDKEEENATKLPKGPEIVLRNNFLHHTFDRDSLLVLEYAKNGPFTINHVIVKGSRISKNPVKHAFFWAFDELPESLSADDAPFSSLLTSIVSRNDDDHLSVKWPPAEHKPGDPFAHVEIGKTSFYGESHLEKPVTGRYLVALFNDNWEFKKGKDKASVQYIGFVGPAEKPNFKKNLASKFGLR